MFDSWIIFSSKYIDFHLLQKTKILKNVRPSFWQSVQSYFFSFLSWMEQQFYSNLRLEFCFLFVFTHLTNNSFSLKSGQIATLTIFDLCYYNLNSYFQKKHFSYQYSAWIFIVGYWQTSYFLFFDLLRLIGRFLISLSHIVKVSSWCFVVTEWYFVPAWYEDFKFYETQLCPLHKLSQAFLYFNDYDYKLFQFAYQAHSKNFV